MLFALARLPPVAWCCPAAVARYRVLRRRSVNTSRFSAMLERGELRLPSRWSLGVVLCLALCALGMGLAGYLALV